MTSKWTLCPKMERRKQVWCGFRFLACLPPQDRSRAPCMSRCIKLTSSMTLPDSWTRYATFRVLCDVVFKPRADRDCVIPRRRIHMCRYSLGKTRVGFRASFLAKIRPDSNERLLLITLAGTMLNLMKSSRFAPVPSCCDVCIC